jgi:hypothetical protein
MYKPWSSIAVISTGSYLEETESSIGSLFVTKITLVKNMNLRLDDYLTVERQAYTV